MELKVGKSMKRRCSIFLNATFQELLSADEMSKLLPFKLVQNLLYQKIPLILIFH